MRPRAKRIVQSALLSKGFRQAKTDHEKYFFYYNNRKTSLWAKVSFESKGKDIIQRELRGMARTLQIKAEELEELIDCTWKEENMKKHAESVLKYLYKKEDTSTSE